MLYFVPHIIFFISFEISYFSIIDKNILINVSKRASSGKLSKDSLFLCINSKSLIDEIPQSDHSNIIFVVLLLLALALFFLETVLSLAFGLNSTLENVESQQSVDLFQQLFSFLVQSLVIILAVLNLIFVLLIYHQFDLMISTKHSKVSEIQKQWQIHQFFTVVVHPSAKFLLADLFQVSQRVILSKLNKFHPVFQFEFFGNHNPAKNQVIYHDFKNNNKSLGAFPRKVNFIALHKFGTEHGVEVIWVHLQQGFTDWQTVFSVKDNRSITVNLWPHDLQKVDILVFCQVNDRSRKNAALFGNNWKELLWLVK